MTDFQWRINGAKPKCAIIDCALSKNQWRIGRAIGFFLMAHQWRNSPLMAHRNKTGRNRKGKPVQSTRHASAKREWSANLRLRPRAPNLGRGRIQTQISRAFLAAGVDTLSSSSIYDFTYAGRRQDVCGRKQHSVYRLLVVLCDRVGRATTIGRPWIWRLKDGSEYGQGERDEA